LGGRLSWQAEQLLRFEEIYSFSAPSFRYDFTSEQNRLFEEIRL